MQIVPLTIIIPARNSESTLELVLKSVEKQDYPIKKVVILDNKSTDNTAKIAKDFAKKSKLSVQVIVHKRDMGLSYSYNEAISKVRTKLVITLQSDSTIEKKNGVRRLVREFEKNSNVVSACSLHITPMKIWNQYNFWQKCLFSRLAGKVLSGRNGRFCCFNTSALKRVGMFKTKYYRSAGEDGDMFYRLMQIGEVVDVNTLTIHLHSMNDKFKLKDYIYKENQLAEAVGATMAHNMKRTSVRSWHTALIRPILIMGLFIPKINYIFALLIVVYVFYYTKDVFIKARKDIRILALPFINLFLLFSFTFYFLRGIITKRQKL